MRVVGFDEMQNIESLSFNDYGLSETTIIEHVGLKAFDYIKENYKQTKLIVVAGKGNNGADAVAMARQAFNSGYTVKLFCIYEPEQFSIELKNQIVCAENFGLEIIYDVELHEVDSVIRSLDDSTLIIDGVLGMGFKAPLDDNLKSLFHSINKSKAKTVSLDIPSGVDADCGLVDDVAVFADTTLSVALVKTGCLVFEGKKYSKNIAVLDSGFPKDLLLGGNKELINEDILKGSSFTDDFHKNDLGHCLIVGGSFGMTGAPKMSATASLKSGSGLVTVISWRECFDHLVMGITPEIMTGIIEGKENFNSYDTLLIGPGLGLGKRSELLLETILSNFENNLIIDADALNVLSSLNFLEKLKTSAAKNIILTPHMGEFSRLLKLDSDIIAEATIDYAREFANEFNCHVILKDSTSYYALPNGKIYILHFPNRGLATAGSGDVLAGIIAGTVSKGARNDLNVEYSITSSMYIHSKAGFLAKERLGKSFMSASNIIEEISSVLKDR